MPSLVVEKPSLGRQHLYMFFYALRPVLYSVSCLDKTLTQNNAENIEIDKTHTKNKSSALAHPFDGGFLLDTNQVFHTSD